MKNQIKKITEKTQKDFEQFKPDVLLNEGDDLLDYGMNAKVIHLPGHTQGSIGILCENGELIAGDIFANMKKPSLAPNAADFKQMDMSLKKLKALHIKTIYPGHGKSFTANEITILRS